eukprot:CAMPEP_0201877942 /NCGR_PEP_ID=MMETSP0902-20130614/9228_1 /ASSEMBLY_ACC=CAM_ASM_000551 /TAXON_ID=420261 /ORGANISM="Thalassiosira antarctica, Strain CCMP982" /LENGTH=38 /DNA_ID= /DNA_START= /DNA_END= /DNA_ORIENTATION=
MNDDADAIAEKEEAPIFPNVQADALLFREDGQIQAAVR